MVSTQAYLAQFEDYNTTLRKRENVESTKFVEDGKTVPDSDGELPQLQSQRQPFQICGPGGLIEMVYPPAFDIVAGRAKR